MSETTESPPLLELVADVLGVGVVDLSEESGPATLAAWTSRKHLELVVTLEEFYGVSLSYSEIRGLRSISAAKRILAAKGVGV